MNIFLRKYPLGAEETPGSMIFYSLVFTHDGQMLVHRKKDYDQTYTLPTESEISSEHFKEYMVEGVPLSKLVMDKLSSILPK